MVEGSHKKISELFKIYENNNIYITPLYNIIDGKNNKDDFKKDLNKYWENVKSSRRVLFPEVYEALNDGVLGYAIRTGKFNGGKNGLMVIDWDVKKTTKPDLLNRLHSLNTLTIKTPSGGFHFLFQYSQHLPNARTGIFGNVDILTDNKIKFDGMREDGEYSLFKKAPIKKLDENIIIELNEYQPSYKELIKNNQKPNIIKVESPDFTYDISNDDLLKILDFLPPLYLNDWSPWLSLTFIFKKYGLYDVWAKWSMKSSKYNEKKNIEIWNLLNIEKDNKNLNYIIFIVNHYIKKQMEEEGRIKYKLFKGINKVYGQYMPLSTKNAETAIKINEKHIPFELFDQYADIIIRSGTNTGKSYALRKYIKFLENEYPKIKVLSISHLISLCQATIAGFEKEDLNITDYKDHKPNEEPVNIAYVVNSIEKIQILDFSNYIIYLDEIHALIKVLLTSSTLNTKRKQILRILTQILKNCRQIIATDGCICDNVLTFIKKLNRIKPIKFYINEFQSYKDKKAYFINDYDEIFEKLKEDIINNNPVMICCNTRKEVEILKEKLKQYIKDPTKFKAYTSKEGDILGDVNNEWDNNFIIFSPSIVEGVDDNNPKNIYVFCQGNTTINPEQVSQQIARNRNPLETYIYINVIDNELKFKDVEEVKQYYRNSENAFIGCYADLVDTISSIGDGVKIYDNDYSLMFYELEYNERLMMSSFEYYLKEILIKKGYILYNNIQYSYDTEEQPNQDKKILEQIKENNKNAFYDYIETKTGNIKFVEDIEKKAEILGLTTHKTKDILTDDEKQLLKEYENIIMDDKKFEIHLNNRSIIKTDYYLKKELAELNKKDFYYKLIDSKNNKIITFRTLLNKYFPNISPFNFAYNENDINNVDIMMDDKEFINLKKCLDSRTDKKPTNNIDLLRKLYLLAKKIYGDDIITRTETHIKDQKRKSKMLNTVKFNIDNFKKHLNLYKIYLNQYPDQRIRIEDEIISQYQI